MICFHLHLTKQKIQSAARRKKRISRIKTYILMSSLDQRRGVSILDFLPVVNCSNIGLHMHVHLHNIYGRKSWVMVNKKEVNLDIFWVNLEINNSKLKKLKNSRLTSCQLNIRFFYKSISSSIYLISFRKKGQASYRFLCPKNKNVINYYNKNQFDYLIDLIALCKADRDDLYL